ncbi:LOW QUALITY PROTEIN: hypothetical protein NC652_002989 [Populus alba x Populus x berolinensis]|nr:LOW QUALITY PROTEIN: hypothetical protein NC652_002989 [Populus alba x Populus x berolinensis]
MDPHGRLSSHTKLSSSKVARSKKPVFLLAISQCGKHTHNTLFPFSHRDRHQCPSVDHTHLPPICYHDELLSRLKKTHSDPEPNTTSKSSSWKAKGQPSYQSLSRLQRKNQGQLLCFGCTINVVFNFQLLCDV